MVQPVRRSSDEGAALVLVVGTMLVLLLLVTASLGLVLNSMQPARNDQDSRRAFAAAQAGIDDFTARLNANDVYYRAADTDTSNPATNPTAASPRGATVPGAGPGGATFRYEVLNEATVPTSGVVRLKVTGYAANQGTVVQRSLIATFRPDSFLNYVYVTDLETEDPAQYATDVVYKSNVSVGGVAYDFYVNPAQVRRWCSRYYYNQRPNASFKVVDGSADASLWRAPKGGEPSAYSGSTPYNGTTVSFSCKDFPFITNDYINGPMHTNDAISILGSVYFMSPITESSWNAKPADGMLWWSLTAKQKLPKYQPHYAQPMNLPQDNSELTTVAATDRGCTYSGATRITLKGTKMQVWSPNTTAAAANTRRTCIGATKDALLDIPDVVYVRDWAGPCTGTSSTNLTGVGFPLAGESTSGPHNPDFGCGTGDAYVSGELSGALTVAAAHDVVVVGDTTYKDGVTGTDVLGLIANRNVWVYHPVNTAGTANLPGFSTVYKIDAALLAINNSILVQNWELAPPLSNAASAPTKLNIRGTMIQKYRGRVADMGFNNSGPVYNHGYLKNYVYDTRLPRNPPPYFIKPLSSPWYVDTVTDR